MDMLVKIRQYGLAMVVLVCLLPAAYAAEQANGPSLKEILTDKFDSESTEIQPSVENDGVQDEHNRDTPRSSFQGLIEALDNRDYSLALEFMDLRNLPKKLTGKSLDLSRELKIILDRSFWIDPDTLSADLKGHRNDGLKSYRDLMVTLEIPNGTVDLYMQHVPDGKGAYIWQLSNRSVAKIPSLYQHYGYGEIGDKLARNFPEYSLLGLVVWQWVMLFGIMLVSFLGSWITTRGIAFILRVRKVAAYDQLNKFLSGPARFLMLIMIGRAMFDSIAPTNLAKAAFDAKTLLIVAFAWLLMGLVELAFGRLGERMKQAGNDQAMVLLRPATTMIKVILLLVALLSWLDNLGFSVTTLITGLGVGGLAVGLAAQKSIENLIGSVTMYIAQPVRVGELCRVGDTLGVVEQIGLRSTMLRTIERTTVTIPNAVFSNMDIENLTSRDRILYRRRIRLQNNTKPNQVRTVLDRVRRLFLEHESVNSDPARIRFIAYGEHSLELEAFAYIDTQDFNEYLAVVEDLNLRILDVIEAAGTQLAVPARTVRMEERSINQGPVLAG